jgi:lysophospholipase L1-like esterase
MRKLLLLMSILLFTSGKEFSDTNPIILFIGDSLTCGYISPKASAPPSDFVTIPKYEKVNLGVGGIKMIWMDSIIGQSIIKYKPCIMVIQIGINDLGNGGLPKEVFSSLKTFCLKYKTMGYKIIVATLPSVTTGYGGIERIEYNTLIRNNYLKFASGIVDLGADNRIGLTNSYSDTTYFNGGIHMSYNGYKVTASLMENSLNSLIMYERRLTDL